MEDKELIREYARNKAIEAGIDPNFVDVTIQQESDYNPSAKSSKDAYGLMQVIPETLAGMKRLGYVAPENNMTTPQEQIDAGVAYMKYLKDKLGANATPEAIAAGYVAGESVARNSMASGQFDINALPTTGATNAQTYVSDIMSKLGRTPTKGTNDLFTRTMQAQTAYGAAVTDSAQEQYNILQDSINAVQNSGILQREAARKQAERAKGILNDANLDPANTGSAIAVLTRNLVEQTMAAQQAGKDAAAFGSKPGAGIYSAFFGNPYAQQAAALNQQAATTAQRINTLNATVTNNLTLAEKVKTDAEIENIGRAQELEALKLKLAAEKLSTAPQEEVLKTLEKQIELVGKANDWDYKRYLMQPRSGKALLGSIQAREFEKISEEAAARNWIDPALISREPKLKSAALQVITRGTAGDNFVDATKNYASLTGSNFTTAEQDTLEKATNVYSDIQEKVKERLQLKGDKTAPTTATQQEFKKYWQQKQVLRGDKTMDINNIYGQLPVSAYLTTIQDKNLKDLLEIYPRKEQETSPEEVASYIRTSMGDDNEASLAISELYKAVTSYNNRLFNYKVFTIPEQKGFKVSKPKKEPGTVGKILGVKPTIEVFNLTDPAQVRKYFVAIDRAEQIKSGELELTPTTRGQATQRTTPARKNPLSFVPTTQPTARGRR